MDKLPVVAPLRNDRLQPACGYDAVITTLGYEERARSIAEKLQPCSRHRYAFGFTEQRVHSYAENRKWFETAGFDVDDVDDATFSRRVTEICRQLDSTAKATSDRKAGAGPTILVDISSLTRSRLARIIAILRSQEFSTPFFAYFFYSLAKYDPPPKQVALNSHVGPVTPEFAGWSEDPNRGVACIVGLGYEEDKALGAVEHVQAVDIWAYVPQSPIAAYSSALSEANETLMELIPKDRRLSYQVLDPLGLYGRLESLVYRLTQERNVILFPFGPKIFTLCSLLAACPHGQAAVWRVSAEGMEDAIDRVASEYVCGLEVCFPPTLPGFQT